MSQKPDKELNRLKHELENVRQQYSEARKQLLLKDLQLDAAEKLESKIKAQGFQDENDALRKELAGAREVVRILQIDGKKKLELGERRPKVKEEEANALLRKSRCPNGTCNVIIEDLKGAAKEEAEKHKQEIEASSQKLKTLTDQFTKTSKSYMAVAEMYGGLVEDTVKRDRPLANNAPENDFEELLRKHNDLKRAHALKVQQCSDLGRLCQAQSEDYEERYTRYAKEMKDMSQKFTTKLSKATSARIEQMRKEYQDWKRERDELDKSKDLDTEKKIDGLTQQLQAVKAELDQLKASNAESAARYEQWRVSMLRVASEAPISVLETQPEVKESSKDA